MIGTPARLTLDRAVLRERYLANRRRSNEIFGFAPADAYTERPILLRHPIVFYEGHLPVFSYLTLLRRALGAKPLDEAAEKLFERGIDPASLSEAEAKAQASWPTRAEVQALGARYDAAVLDALANADLTNASASPLLEHGEAAWTILEHEEMHHETLLYLIHRIAPERKNAGANAGVARATIDRPPSSTGRVQIPAGSATLGAVRGDIAFGWDNEFAQTRVDVPAFEIDRNAVTNAEYLEFVRAGGPVPSFWIKRPDGFALLTQFDILDPMPAHWPVFATQEQAAAYAAWRGARLPTEAEYHRVAYGTPEGTERAFPWGDEAPTTEHGNFGFRRYDPESVGASPKGNSAFGVTDLIGNGWEWTATQFGPLPGFAPMASYPQYSADFFDGVHYVIKGASPVTATHHVRRSFRNWYRGDYPYVYAKFRTVNG